MSVFILSIIMLLTDALCSALAPPPPAPAAPTAPGLSSAMLLCSARCSEAPTGAESLIGFYNGMFMFLRALLKEGSAPPRDDIITSDHMTLWGGGADFSDIKSINTLINMVQKTWANKVKQKQFGNVPFCWNVEQKGGPQSHNQCFFNSDRTLAPKARPLDLNCDFKLNPSGCLEELLVDEEEVGDL